MAEIAPVVPPKENEQVPPVTLKPEEEVAQLKAKIAELEPKAQEAEKLKGDVNNAVSELIELRKKKAISPEEKTALEEQIKKKDEEIALLKKQRNESVINSLASQPIAPSTPKANDTQQLTPEEEKLRVSKGWTVEKFLNMKSKYANVIFPKGI